MEIQINPAHLRAAFEFSADKDIRYYLNGILVEACASEVRLVATDGNMMGVLRELNPLTDGASCTVIIPNATVKTVIGMKAKTLTLTDQGGWALGGVRFTPLDGSFPDYRRVLTKTHSGEAAQFNVDYLARILKAGKALGAKNQPIIRHNGDGGAQVQFCGHDEEFVGVIMPLRAFTEKHPDTGLVQWGPDRAK